LVYFYDGEDETAKAFFASLLKQLLATLIKAGKSCPQDVRKEIEESYGMGNRQPDIAGLVTQIIIPLMSMFKVVVILLDGVDVCGRGQQAEIWKYLSKIVESSRSEALIRVIVSSQDQANVVNRLPNIQRIRIDQGSNAHDIDTFIDNEIAHLWHSGPELVLHDRSLQATVKQALKEKANGMHGSHSTTVFGWLLTLARFLWAALVLGIIVECDNPDAAVAAIKDLPTDLEKLYLQCLSRRREDYPVCNPILLMTICATPKLMHVQAVRQLLALDMATGDCLKGREPSIDAIKQSGAGLLILDDDEELLLPAHDSVRTFIFSEAAYSAIQSVMNDRPSQSGTPSYSDAASSAFGLSNESYILDTMRGEHARLLEQKVRIHLGRSCLVHIQRRASRTLSVHSGVRTQKVPAAMALISSPSVNKMTKAFFPLTSHSETASLKLPASRQKMPSSASTSQAHFLQYATENWISCNRDIREPVRDKRDEVELDARKTHLLMFASVASKRNESWNVHPWPAMTSSQHLVGMFAYSVANDHVPLLELALHNKEAMPKHVFTDPLLDHGYLPPLHVACKLGYSNLTRILLRHQVCRLWTICPQSRTALHVAAESGQLECVRVLLGHLSAFYPNLDSFVIQGDM
jgi:hypothetical protein